jgi:hypothetical protein
MQLRGWMALRLFAALAFWASSTFIAFHSHALAGGQEFGTSTSEVLAGFYLAAMLTGPTFALFCILLPGSSRRALRIAIGSLVATAFLAHAHLAADDAAFRAEVGDCIDASHHRARAEPFGSYGIGCRNGEFSAHD